jgi:hypothetical protein
MQVRVRRVLVAVALVAGLALPSRGDVTGRVIDPANQSLVDSIATALALERDARALLNGLGDEEKPDPETRLAFIALMTDARNGLLEVQYVLNENKGVPGSNARNALKDVERVVGIDFDLIVRAGNGTGAKSLRGQLDYAEGFKKSAMLLIQGIPATPKDSAAAAANPPPPAVAVEPDLGGLRKIFKFTPEDLLSGRAQTVAALARAVKQKFPKYNSKYLTVQAFQPVPNYYYAFTGKGDDPGTLWKSLWLSLVGPFEVKFRVGTYDLEDVADTGIAFVRFDLEGSDPAQFLRVGGRRVNGGVELSAVSHLGAAGTMFLPGARLAQVRVAYSGGQFVCAAAEGADAPDFVLQTFATVPLAQGEAAFVPALGGEDLRKGGVVHLDEVYFTPQ